MDPWHTADITEDDKYAFLLGSALRNDDLEQLFTVYDSLIPHDISQTRLKRIKEDARQISELSESKFSCLVLNAHSYSLAPGRSSMSQSNRGNIAQLAESSRDNCLIDSFKRDEKIKNHVIHTSVDEAACQSLDSFNEDVCSKKHLSGFDSVVKTEFDAALNDSDSGLQDSCCKVSSVNHSDSIYGDSEEDRPGSFDYMPSHSHGRIARSFNPPYDEVKVDSSAGGSSIESPRSETSVTQDEYNLAEEGTEMATLSYKETPHVLQTDRKHYEDCWDYVPSTKRSDDEDMEDEENERARLRNLYTVSSFMSALPRSVSSQFDQSISYGLKQLEGNGSGHLNPRITLTSCNQYRDQYKSEETREKEDKKKNKTKDDTDKPEVSGLVDVNGNPRTVDIANSSQMRQLPRGKSDNTVLGNLANYTSAAISQSYSSSLAETNTLDRKKERRRLKLERQKWTPAEAYEDHKEFSDIKEILDFVEGGASAPSKSEGSKSAKKKQERSRKKDPHLNGTVTLEDTAGEDGPNCVDSVALTATARLGFEAMGNSSIKSQGENQIILRTESTEDIFDKNVEFHDCLNTLPTETVIANNVENHPQSDRLETVRKYSSSDEADRNDLKGSDIVDKSVKDKNNILSKKSLKVKGKKDQHGSAKENDPVSLASVHPVKSKESSEMKDSLLMLKSVPIDNSKHFHSSSDTEIPSESKREDSFTEVKKRKKRLGGRDFNTAPAHYSTVSSYQIHNHNGHTQRNISRPRPVTPPAVGITAFVSNNRSLPVTDQTNSSRDLSPSAFPVLLGHNPLTPHTDNRRNSCGDLSCDFIDNKTYDSDRESARSLPDAHRTRISGDASPVYPMSYARIAAAPRRNDCTNSPSSESGVASGSQNSSISSSVTHTPGSSIDMMSPQSPSSAVGMPDRKATVWKGSPRERRHSIGSGPEDKADKEKASVAQCNRQCGSQEVLSRETVRAGPADAAPLSAEAIHHSEKPSSSHDSDRLEVAVPPLAMLSSHKPKHSMCSVQTSTKAPVLKLSPENTASGTQGVPKPVTCQPGKQADTVGSSDLEQKMTSAVAASDFCKVKNGPSSATAAIVSAMPVPAGDNHDISSGKDKVTPHPHTSRKTGTNTKFVIFLDKRFSSSPQNLGITFGFDSSEESVCEPASQSTSHCRHTPLPSKPQALSPQDSSASSSAQTVCSSTNPVHIPATDVTALISSDHALSHSLSHDSNSSKPVAKGPHIQGLCNGLILPSSIAGDSVRQLEHDTGSSINNNSQSTVTNVASSIRTSLSTLKPEMQACHIVGAPVASSLAVPGQPRHLLGNLASESMAQIIQPLPQTTAAASCVALTGVNPADVIYSPNHPPPPLPVRVVAVTGDRSSISDSTSSLPSRRDSIPETLKASACTESSVGACATLPMGTEAAGAICGSATLTFPPKTEAISQLQLVCADTTEMVPIIYGEKIKPVAGCGKILFVLNNISQKSKESSAEAATFLRKKWLDNVSHRKGSVSFSTLNQD